MQPSRVGSYEILEQLGSGGMATVYLGRHVETGVQAAVKVLPASLAREGSFVERFHREIDALKKLHNPHIVRFYESGDQDDSPYYVMEYVPGETVLSLLHREKRVPWPRAVEIALQLCPALKAAHDAGIVHRDLKPSNLLISTDGTVKLSDFGVAQVFAESPLTATGGIIGTAEYMSPEQAQGKRATKHSDLYSLGAVLYALVTGRPPFVGPVVDVVQKHKFGVFDRPRNYVAELPLGVEEIICQLLEKDPAKRFPDALVLQRRLEQALARYHNPAEEYTLVNTGVVITEGEPADPEALTIENIPQPEFARSRGGPGPATMMKDFVRAELTRVDKPNWFAELFDNTYVLIGTLVLLIGGSVWMYRSRSTATDADSFEWTDSPIQESEAKRFFRVARHYRQVGDIGQAIAKLRALQALLAGDSSQSQLYEQTSQYLKRLEAEQSTSRQQYQLLEDSLSRAEKLAAEGKASEAAAVWRAVIELYGTDPGAADQVQQARESLARTNDTTETRRHGEEK